MVEEKKKTYPKYQWSYFLDDKRNNQIVVREENSKALENALVKVIPLIKKIKTEVNGLENGSPVTPTQPVVPQQTPPPPTIQQPTYQQSPITPAQEEGLQGWCRIHTDAGGNPVKLRRKISKKGNEYWAHYRQLTNGEWDTCFGNGWMSEKPQGGR